MKNFDEFINFVNTSENLQNALLSEPLNLEKNTLDLTTKEGFEKLSHAFEERTLNQFMKILRAYHEWINEK